MKKSNIIKTIMLVGLTSIACPLFGEPLAWEKVVNDRLKKTPPVYFKVVDAIPAGVPSVKEYTAAVDGDKLNIKLIFKNLRKYSNAKSNPQSTSLFESTGEFKFVGHKPDGAGEVTVKVGTDVEDYTIGTQDKSFFTKVGNVDYKVTIHTDVKDVPGLLLSDSSATRVYLVSVSAEEITGPAGQCNGNVPVKTKEEQARDLIKKFGGKLR